MKKITLLILLTYIGVSCKTADPESEEEELITTVELTFTEGTSTKKIIWKDVDGAGGNAPVIDAISLEANKKYDVSVQFLNEAVSPAEDITSEVAAESDEHLVVFSFSPSNLLSYSYSDKDVNGFPIGLKGTIQTSQSGNGILKVQLRHQPPINNMPVKNGTASPGSDDINVDFAVTVR